jgi:hypothetical protein
MKISDFRSSRISWPNNIFPALIQISHEGVTFIKSGFLSATARTIPFSNIKAVKLKCQFLGFSTITIQGDGDADIHAGGFTKMEVRSMKKLILGYLHTL